MQCFRRGRLVMLFLNVFANVQMSTAVVEEFVWKFIQRSKLSYPVRLTCFKSCCDSACRRPCQRPEQQQAAYSMSQLYFLCRPSARVFAFGTVEFQPAMELPSVTAYRR